MNKIDNLKNDFENFKDIDNIIDLDEDLPIEDMNISEDFIIEHNREPQIIELESFSKRELKHLENYNIHSDMMYKKKKKPRKYVYKKYLENSDTSEKDMIDLKIVSALKYYGKCYLYKETRVKGVYVNSYGDFYKLKNDCKVRVSYLQNNLGYPTISIFGKVYNARNLIWETFVCPVKNIKLSYKNKKYGNEIQNITYKFK